MICLKTSREKAVTIFENKKCDLRALKFCAIQTEMSFYQSRGSRQELELFKCEKAFLDKNEK